jgi:hypothetical protein
MNRISAVENWVCKICGKPGCRATGIYLRDGKFFTSKPGVICRCDQPRWEVFNWTTGLTYPVPEWFSKKYPQNS